MIIKKINGRSQYNEDAIIEKIFENLKISKGVFFEIGVNNMTLDKSIQCNSINLLNKGWKGKLVDEELFDPIMSQLVSSMRGPLPKRDLVAEIFDPVLKNKKYKKLTKMAIQRCVDSYQDSHPK